MALFNDKKVTKFIPLDKKRIEEELLARGITLRTEVYDLIPSTNTAALEFARENPDRCAIFLAEAQSAGSGRLGRRFHSPEGAGLYMTLLIYPEGVKCDGVWLTTLAAVALRRAVKNLTPLDPKIKWVNDLYIDGKKLAGILARASLDEKGGARHLLIGIGINVYDAPLPEDIRETATSIEAAGGGRIDRNALAAEITKELFSALKESPDTLIAEYKNASLVLGKRIKVIEADGEYYATATDITDSGELILTKDDKKRVILSTGEVSIRDF